MVYSLYQKQMCVMDKQERGRMMKEDKNFFIVDKSVLPEIFLKVMEVKNLLESKKEKTGCLKKRWIGRGSF